MPQFLKQFEVRWDDLDPNRHVANSTFSVFMNETRMSYLRQNGFTQDSFEKNKIGPVIFSEEFYYLKEILPGEVINVNLELLAHSEDYKFIKFSHCLFNSKGELSVYSEIYFSWFDLVTRKLIASPPELKQILDNMPKSEKFEILAQVSLRANSKIPFGRTLKQDHTS